MRSANDISPLRRGRPPKVAAAASEATLAKLAKADAMIDAGSPPSKPRRQYRGLRPSPTPPLTDAPYAPPDQANHWPASEFGELVVKVRIEP